MQQNAINDLLLLISITIDVMSMYAHCTDKHTNDTKYSNECLFNVVQIQTSLMLVLCVSIGNTNK